MGIKLQTSSGRNYNIGNNVFLFNNEEEATVYGSSMCSEDTTGTYKGYGIYQTEDKWTVDFVLE